MKVREMMTQPAIRISGEESVEVAARTLAHYNIGMLPVCGKDGRLCGVVTDRDLVTRCLASGRKPGQTKVKEIMSGSVVAAEPDMDSGEVARLMARQQVRRLPVMQNGKLCGMVSVGDLANREESCAQAGQALAGICTNISER